MRPPPTPDDPSATASLLKALADENRLRIVALVARDEVCVCHLASALELTQPNVSQHLTVLRNAGIVTGERRGSWIHYRLRAEPARASILEAVLASVEGLPSTGADRSRLAAIRLTIPCP